MRWSQEEGEQSTMTRRSCVWVEGWEGCSYCSGPDGKRKSTCMFYTQTGDDGHVKQTLLLLLHIRMSSLLKNRFLILMGFCIKHYQTKGKARKGDLSLLMSTNENLKSALPQMSTFVYIKK